MTRPPERHDDDAWLDQMLEDVANTPMPDASDALLSRVMADAQAQLPPPGGVVTRAPWWRQIVAGLGGWSAVGGLVAAAATGFVVGLGGLDNVGLDTLWPDSYDIYYDSQDAFSAYGWDLEEG